MLFDGVNRQSHHRQPLAQFSRTEPGTCKLFKPLVTNEHLFEFFQKPDIVLEEQTNIIELVHQPAHAIDSKTKREPVILPLIDSDRAQHVRMHHSGTAQLDPTRVLANSTTTSLALEATEIKLGARLSERKVRRSKARNSVRSKHSS